ncbi:hypothetical protein C8J57DRAFT_1231836 [Mycena rebaudengoi]|nr:hypothetical protein C8J57DRAFT_1231836 [Mycena rebaudengoi]
MFSLSLSPLSVLSTLLPPLVVPYLSLYPPHPRFPRRVRQTPTRLTKPVPPGTPLQPNTALITTGCSTEHRQARTVFTVFSAFSYSLAVSIIIINTLYQPIWIQAIDFASVPLPPEPQY